MQAGICKGCVRHRIEGAGWDWQGVCSGQDRGMGLQNLAKKCCGGKHFWALLDERVIGTFLKPVRNLASFNTLYFIDNFNDFFSTLLRGDATFFGG